MQNGDEASPSIILAGRALLVKMLITLEFRGIFASNFVYLCILTLSSHCHAKRWRGFVKHHFGWSSSFTENAHNSWTPWYIHFNFCILMYFNIVRRVPTIYVLSKNKKIITFFHLKITIFTAVKYCYILYGHVCVMSYCHAKRWRGFTEHHFSRSNWLCYINYGLCILL